jgi:hypothetical protein
MAASTLIGELTNWIKLQFFIEQVEAASPIISNFTQKFIKPSTPFLG